MSSGTRKAAVVLPGIMGSRLFAADDIYEGSKLKHRRNQLLWINTPDIREFLKPTWSLSKRKDKIAKGLDLILSGSNRINALKCHPDGTSVHAIKAAGLDDTPPCDGHENFCLKSNTRHFGAAGMYTELVTSLKSLLGEENAAFLSYDWRKPIASAAAQITPVLDEFAKSYDEVFIIAHSMGGLVACRYLSQTIFSQKFKLITLGTPFLGAPKALRILLTGDALPAHYCDNAILKTAHNISAVHELMPTRQYMEEHPFVTLIKKGKVSGAPLNPDETVDFLRGAGMNMHLFEQAQNFHQRNNFARFFNDSPNTLAIVGNGKSTEISMIASQNQRLVYYTKTSKNGDGTVPAISAAMNGQLRPDKIIYVKESHSGLPSNKKILSLIHKKIEGWFAP